MKHKYNIVYNEDCLDTIARKIPYHYCIMGFPDLSELDNITPYDYRSIVHNILSKLDPINNVITIQATDRKYKGGILQKHNIYVEIMNELGWKLVSQKIWVKSYKINLFRLEYSFLLTFRRGKIPVKTINLPDVFYIDKSLVYTKEAKGAYPQAIAEAFIKCYTQKGEVVYDPFMGSGVTAIAALETGRKYLGSEIDLEIYLNFKEKEKKWSKNK